MYENQILYTFLLIREEPGNQENYVKKRESRIIPVSNNSIVFSLCYLVSLNSFIGKKIFQFIHKALTLAWGSLITVRGKHIFLIRNELKTKRKTERIANLRHGLHLHLNPFQTSL